MRAVLIPVKDLRCAKQRLAPVLSQAERTALATAMMEDVFSAVAEARGVDEVYVVSNHDPVLDRARSLGWEVIRERRQVSESDSVDRASRSCAAHGVRSLLRLPIDIPLLRSADIKSVLAAGRHRARLRIGSVERRHGNQRVVAHAAGVFRSHFGPNSLCKHIAEAEGNGGKVRVLRNARIELDVDDVHDLRILAVRNDVRGATKAWLRRAGFLAAANEAACAD